MDITTVQISKLTKATLDQMAKSDMRSAASEMEWLIQREYARRQNPSPVLVTIVVDGEERNIPALITRDHETGKITIMPSH